MEDKVTAIYKLRWSGAGSASKDSTNRENAWDALVSQVFQELVNTEDSVLDLGSGPGFFINRILCKKKYALDLDIENSKKMKKDVIFINEDAKNIDKLTETKFDVVFSSNFLEHLDSPSTLLNILQKIKSTLSSRESKLILMLPNVTKTGLRFYDFIDHTLPLTDRSICEALILSGYRIIEMSPGFFPYSARSSRFLYPKFIYKMYLKIPLKNRPFAGQMLVIASLT